MADDKSKNGPAYAARINIRQPHEVRAVRPMVTAVRRHLEK